MHSGIHAETGSAEHGFYHGKQTKHTYVEKWGNERLYNKYYRAGGVTELG